MRMHPVILCTLMPLVLAGCPSESTHVWPTLSAEGATHARSQNEAILCAKYPEACEGETIYDDSNMPADPCRDYGQCDEAGSSTGGGEGTCPSGCSSHPPGCDIKG